MANPIPAGRHSLQPYIRVVGADKAIAFYTQAFGAQEIERMAGPTGAVMHCELKIGDSVLMLSEEFKEWGVLAPPSTKGTPVTIQFYTDDVDATHAKAVAAGAKSTLAPWDAFWGDRIAKVVDPFGHEWSIATHKEDLSSAEIKRRSAEFFAKMPPQK